MLQHLANAVNFRDLGGLTLPTGRVKSGLLFRAGTLHFLTEDEQQFLDQQLNLQVILDYRDQEEVQQQPDQLWSDVEYIHAPANPADSSLTADMQAAMQSKHLAVTNPMQFMLELYQRLPFANPGYQQLVKLLNEAEPRPLVQHCTAGKDRTGVGVALTLFALGADEATVMEDYLQTEQGLAPYREKLIASMGEHLNAQARESLQVVLAAKAQFLQAALDAIKVRYQTIDAWLANDYGLTQRVREQLCERYLD